MRKGIRDGKKVSKINCVPVVVNRTRSKAKSTLAKRSN